MIPSAVAVDALIAHLRNKLSASVVTVNSERYSEVLVPKKGSYVVPVGDYWIGVGVDTDLNSGVAGFWPVPAGTYTAQQLATHLNSEPVFDPWSGLPTSVVWFYEDSRLGAKWPASAGPIVVLGGLDAGFSTADLLAPILGVGADGVASGQPNIIAPSYEGICDGFPLLVPDMGSGFWVIIGDREAAPDDGSSLRRDSWTVRTSLHIMRPSYANERHRTREPISACLDAVRRCLLTDEGRQLGKAATGEIQIVEITSERVGGTALRFEEMQNVLFDTASLDVAIRVYQRPSST
jgi:hypothetical protein